MKVGDEVTLIVKGAGTPAEVGDRLRIVGLRRPELSDLYDYDVVHADDREQNKSFGVYAREVE